MAVAAPFNLNAWIDDNRERLKPPVGNACVFDGQFLVMIIGGPNARTDYHINPGEELFYQIEGDIVVKIIDGGQPRDVPIKQGEMFMLPAKVPHSPQRPAGTIGLVVEHPKLYDEDNHLRWYCRGCGQIVHDFAFRPQDLGAQIKEMLTTFKADEKLRTCKGCGEVYAI